MATSHDEMLVEPAAVPGQLRQGDDVFPSLLACRIPGASLAAALDWVRSQAAALLDESSRRGALLLRGFPVQTDRDFHAMVEAFGQPAFTYEDSLSNAVRVNRTPRVFTANEAPPDVQIFFHHEMAQTPYYPTRLFFFCEQAAATGGATPLCRSDWLWERLLRECPKFAADVEAQGLRYSHVMPGEVDLKSGMGRSWQSTLKAATREAAENRLSSLNYTWQWLDDGCLRVTTPVLRGVYRLPDGRKTFFNQLIAAFSGWKDARNDPAKAITLGDGTPLDPVGVQAACRIAEELAFDVPWQNGDVALIDNYVTMHGRRPFTGTRKVLAAFI